MTFPPLPWKSANRELWLQVLSIFLPGFIVVTEVALGVSRDLVATLLGANLNFIGGTLLFVLVLATSYALGLLSRTVGFGIEEWAEQQATSHPWLQRVVRPRSVGALEYVQARYTADGVRAALQGTPFFDEPPVGHAIEAHHVHGGSFAFAKYWLRLQAPSMGVDRNEIDVNVRLALVVPVALAAVAVVPNRDLLLPRTTDHPLATTVVTVLVTVALALFMLWSGMRARGSEKVDALSRYVVAYHVLRMPPPSREPDTLPAPDAAAAGDPD
jgi:hypothetical protein